MKKLLLIVFLLSNLISKAQFSGIVVNQDTTICTSTSAELTVTFDTIIRETTSYLVQSIPFAPIPYGTASSLNGLVDDNYYGPFPIGFNFCFFGSVWTNFYIGSNGWISFTPIPGAPIYDPWVTAPIPNLLNTSNQPIPRNCVMGPWRDWHPSPTTGGSIKYQVIGTQPHRKLVVTWIDISLFSCNTSHGTFQIVLHETTNIIDNHLITVPTCPTWNNGNGVQGIQNVSGTIAYTVVGRNNTNWTATQQSHRYTPNGNIYSNFTWIDNFGVTYPPITPLIVTPTQPTTYTARLNVCGGFLTSSATVTPNPCGYLTGSSTNVNCFGQSTGSINIEIHDAIPPYDIEWSTGYTILSTNITTISLSNLPAGNYSVTVTALNGIYAIDTTITITQNPQITVNTFSNPESCLGHLDGDITSIVSNGIPPFTFAAPGQPMVTSFTPLYTFPNLSMGNYTVTITDNLGCIATTTQFVNQLEMQSTLNQIDLLCNGDINGMASITVVGGTSPYLYSWSNNNHTNSLTGAGPGTYCVEVTDAKGCQIDTCVTFHNPQPVVVYISSDQTICLSDIAEITSVVVGGTPPYNYIWTGGFGSQSISVSPETSTQYCVLVTDDNGCESNENCATVTVHPPLEMYYEIMDDTICKGDTTTILALLSGGNGGPYFYEIVGEGVVVPPYDIAPEYTRNYLIIGSDNCGTPIVTGEVDINVVELPSQAITTDVLKGCEPLRVNFTELNSVGDNIRYFWSFEGSHFNSFESHDAFHEFCNAGTYTVSVLVTNELGCSKIWTLPYDIEVWPAPTAVFYADPPAASIIHPLIQFRNISIDAGSYFWYINSDTFYTYEPYPYLFPQVLGTYNITLIAENPYECRDTSTIGITIFNESLFYAPNAIRIGGTFSDNEIFKPKIYMLDESSYELYIYDRWGGIIFYSNVYDVGWTGRNGSGEKCPGDTYRYIVKYKDVIGRPFIKFGKVTLLR